MKVYKITSTRSEDGVKQTIFKRNQVEAKAEMRNLKANSTDISLTEHEIGYSKDELINFLNELVK